LQAFVNPVVDSFGTVFLMNVETARDVGEQFFRGMVFETFCIALEKGDKVSVEQNPKARGLNKHLE
jgi:hypothetical protein